MKLNDKIRDTRENLGLTQEQVHDRLKTIFGKNAISLSTIYRVEKGNISKFHSVEQMSFGLGVPLPSLLKNTELENRQVIRKTDEVDHFSGDGYEAKILSSPVSSYLMIRATLTPKSKRPIEQSPSTGNFEKWIHVIKGELTCNLGNEEYILKAGDSISFKSTIEHRLQNDGSETCEYEVLQNPKHF